MPEFPERAPAQVVVFSLGGEWYAIDVERIREVVERGPVTLIPGAPPAVCGLAAIRGRAVPVVDLAALLGGDDEAGATRVIIALVGGEPVGLLVADVDEVVTVDPAAVQSFALPGRHPGAFRGIIQQPDRLIVWVDTDALIPGEVLSLARAA